MSNRGGHRAAKKAATRAKVLDAARACFNTTGYERSTIRDIAHMAGTSTGSIFASFADKAALFREIYGHAPIDATVAAGLLNVVRRAHQGSGVDMEMAAGLLAKIGEAA